MSQSYSLAVDGGGTKCLAVLICHESGIVGTGRAGACNPHSVGYDRARDALSEAVSAACVNLPSGTTLSCAAVGLAGVDTAEGLATASALVDAALQQAGVRAARMIVENDALIALRGAAGGGRGMLVVAGTGSVVYASDGSRFVRTGGWGYQVGDEGSAYDIARQALTAVFRAVDGRAPETTLGDHLCRAVSVANLDQLYEWVYQSEIGVDSLAALAPVVEQAAEDGDVEALAILERAGEDLARAAATAAERAGLLTGDAFPLFLMGGVLQRCRLVREAFLRRLVVCCPGAVPEVPRYQPVLGAALLALGGTVDRQVFEKLAGQVPA